MLEQDNKGPWEVLSGQLLDYLILTRRMSEWLDDLNTDKIDEDGFDFAPLNSMVEERSKVTALLREIDRDALPAEPTEDREAMCRTQSIEMLRQIEELERSSQAEMDKLASGYRKKLKNIKQARETVNAYKTQRAYGLQADLIGTHFNQAN